MDYIADIQELEAQLAAANQKLAEQQGWKCFHCGDTFTDEKDAREHFGTQQTSLPACRIEGGAVRGVLTALRDAEEQLARYYDEDGDVSRLMSKMTNRHTEQLRCAEEIGYERGLKDSATLLATARQTGRNEVLNNPIGEMQQNGVNWFNQNPHAHPIGTKFYAVLPASNERN